MPDSHPQRWAPYHPLQSYYNFHSKPQLSTSPSTSAPQQPPFFTPVKTFTHEIASTTTDCTLAHHLQQMSLTSTSTRPPPPFPSPNPIIKPPQPHSAASSSSINPPTWTLADPLVRSKIAYLYRLCITNFTTTPSSDTDFLARVSAAARDYSGIQHVIQHVIVSWLDGIIDEVRQIYWIEVSRAQVWDVLGEMGELGDTGGIYALFLGVGVEIEGLEGLMGELRM